MKPETITIGDTTVELFRKLHGEEVFTGMTTFCGILCHVYFIRVHQVTQLDHVFQDAVLDPVCRFCDLRSLDPEIERFATVQIPGYQGEYVLYLYPDEW